MASIDTPLSAAFNMLWLPCIVFKTYLSFFSVKILILYCAYVLFETELGLYR